MDRATPHGGIRQAAALQPEPFDGRAWAIASALHQGVLHEAVCNGKPGLVCGDSMGAHTDMDAHTFMAGAAAMLPHFLEAARLGLAPCAGTDDGPDGNRALFARLRAGGLRWEADLLRATRGVNTHRGMLFLGALACAAAGRVLRDLPPSPAATGIPTTGIPAARIPAVRIGALVADMTRGLCARELAATARADRAVTAGERLFAAYGMTGVRGEAEAGLPHVLECGLPALGRALDAGAELSRALLHALLELMAVVPDTTVVHRAGPEGLALVRAGARAALELGGALTPEGRARTAELGRACVARSVSPGGSADLLAMTAGLYLLEHGSWPGRIL
ncbi:MAG: triphosphoribosyl-dephospho-CoA synthase [Desulfovibrionaceae bacterium]|jgi:triphosphoribosyl-dephospho-CoA synthase|nr:triphosphoribosyl-dephospho-CoA synthase [Desulfovibrionaceae bacterium]